MHLRQLPSMKGRAEPLLVGSAGSPTGCHQLAHHAFTVGLELEIAVKPQDA
ncbi:MAG: hypothetical protein ACI9SE_003525, partial [Neolewinella sp.]